MEANSINSTGPAAFNPLPLGTAAVGGPGSAPPMDADSVAAMQRDFARLIAELGDSQGSDLPEPRGDTEVPQSLVISLQSAESTTATDIFAFMALYAKLAQQMRNTAREQRSSELQAQVGALKSAAEEMITAAEQRFNAALVSGVMQIAGGVISIGSSAMTLKALNSKQAVNLDGDDFTSPTPDFTPGSAFMQGLQARQSMATGTSEVLQGSGQLISASMEKSAAQADARAKNDEADGTAAQAQRETAQEVMQTMADILRDIRDKIAAIAQSDIEVTRGIARNI